MFRITSGGTYTVLGTLANRAQARGPLLAASDGNLYGTARTVFAGQSDLIFQVTIAGDVNTLHQFNSTTEGSSPLGLVEGDDGNFYGTTTLGGPHNLGTFFQMTPDGDVTVIAPLPITPQNANPDGSRPPNPRFTPS